MLILGINPLSDYLGITFKWFPIFVKYLILVKMLFQISRSAFKLFQNLSFKCVVKSFNGMESNARKCIYDR